MPDQNATSINAARPTRLNWLVAYISGLLRTKHTGRMQFTLDFHRGSISHLRVAEVKEVPVTIQ